MKEYGEKTIGGGWETLRDAILRKGPQPDEAMRSVRLTFYCGAASALAAQRNGATRWDLERELESSALGLQIQCRPRDESQPETLAEVWALARKFLGEDPAVRKMFYTAAMLTFVVLRNGDAGKVEQELDAVHAEMLLEKGAYFGGPQAGPRGQA